MNKRDQLSRAVETHPAMPQPMRYRTKWLVCRSNSGSIHVSPRLASIYLRIVDIIDTEENLSPERLFDAIVELLPAAEFPPINRSAELGPGNA